MNDALLRKALALLGQAPVDPSPEPALDSLPATARPGGLRVQDLPAGACITYQSPLFGDLRAEVVEVSADGTVTLYQPLTGALVRIPLAWVTAGPR